MRSVMTPFAMASSPCAAHTLSIHRAHTHISIYRADTVGELLDDTVGDDAFPHGEQPLCSSQMSTCREDTHISIYRADTVGELQDNGVGDDALRHGEQPLCRTYEINI